MGFPRENLLTEHARKVWVLWKESHSNEDWWGPGLADPNWKPPAPGPQSELWGQRIRHLEERAVALNIEPEFRRAAIRHVLFPPTGTIHCSALNDKGEISGITTTSGLAFKMAGRCGDSPIIGAGCYTDQDVGSAGATGSGEENIKVAGAHTIVENMRRGMSPREAGMDALKRIVRNYNGDMVKLKFVDMTYYILRKDGAYAGVSLWEGYEKGEPHTIAGSRRRTPVGSDDAFVAGILAGLPADPKIAGGISKVVLHEKGSATSCPADTHGCTRIGHFFLTDRRHPCESVGYERRQHLLLMVAVVCATE